MTISVTGLTKRFGSTVAVDALEFDVAPGRVTGFLGPNGSGKSTTMRCMIGLDRPDAGGATFGGRPYAALADPVRAVGVLLDAGYVHPNRRARHHLAWMAAASGVPRARVTEVLEMVGLADVADNRVKSFSLGMKQRLGLAGALLGDPEVIMLDEPANGLDPEGIRWIRQMLVWLAGQGKTVLVSSHQLAEVALMADDLVVIGQGRLISTGPLTDFVDRNTDSWVRVRSPQMAGLADALGRHPGAEITFHGPDTIEVRNLAAEIVGSTAHQGGFVLHELSPQRGNLEDAFLNLTSEVTDYRAEAPR